MRAHTHGKLGSITRVCLDHRVLQMSSNRGETYGHYTGDLFIASTCRNVLYNSPFSWTQSTLRRHFELVK